jgi:hypothetical protein
LKNINKIDEFANHFNNVNMKYAENIKGFDPNKIFVEHMLSVGFNNLFIHTILNEEEDNNQGTHVQNVDNLETILSTNGFYKQKGKGLNEKSAWSPVVTPKTTTSRSNAPTTHPIRKIAKSISSNRGEKNSPPRKIESSHEFPLRKKRKNVVQEEEDNLIKNDINSFSLEDMELKVDIEKMFPTIDQSGNMAQQNSSIKIVANETFSEEESFTFQSVVFDKESKNLIIERGDQKNKKRKSRSEIDLKDM